VIGLLQGIGSLAVVLGLIGVLGVAASLSSSGAPKLLAAAYAVGALLALMLVTLPVFALARLLERSEASSRSLDQLRDEVRRRLPTSSELATSRTPTKPTERPETTCPKCGVRIFNVASKQVCYYCGAKLP
jgi:hypothetical protein